MDELIKRLSKPSNDTNFDNVFIKSTKYDNNYDHNINIIKMLSNLKNKKIVKQYTVIPIENVITIENFDNLDIIYSILDIENDNIENDIENIKVYCGGNLLYEQNSIDFIFDKNELLIGYHGIPLVSLMYQAVKLEIKIKGPSGPTKINITGVKVNNYDKYILKYTEFDLDLSKNTIIRFSSGMCGNIFRHDNDLDQIKWLKDLFEEAHQESKHRLL